MMQFGLASYQGSTDYEPCLKFVNYYRQRYEMDKQARILIENAVNANDGIGKAVLILARLFFWGHIDAEFAIKLLEKKIRPDSFQLADVFEKQELYDCLGQSFMANFIGSEFLYSKLYTGWEQADHRLEPRFQNLQANDTWTYIPPPTGFFSVIENIILAKFFCLLNNKNFKLDLQHSWWRYPVPFMDIMSAAQESDFNCNLPHVQYITWDVLRKYFRYITPENFDFLKRFKVQEYAKFKFILRKYLDNAELRPRPNPEDCIVFVRGGDKTQIETIETPNDLLLRDIIALQHCNININVLSDDHELAQKLLNQIGLDSSANLTERSRFGYQLQATHTIADVNTIIHNYLILSNARYSLSCPSSNLVNSAHWSNSILNDKYKPASLPSLRYLFL